MYQGLGFDPTPGELAAVTETSAALAAVADALANVEPALRRAAELSQPWQGKAAEAFRARLQDSPPGELGPRLRQASTALNRWADTLIANQRRAEELDVRALRLRKRLNDAWDLLQDKQNARDLASTPAAAAEANADLASASTLVTDLESELDRVLAEARSLERDHRTAADTVAAELAGETPRRTTDSALGRRAGAVLRMASDTAGTLGGLLLPAGHAIVPAGAAGALAAALAPGEQP